MPSSIKTQLLNELRGKMSLNRLARVGLFQKLDDGSADSIKDELRLFRAVLDKALVDSFSQVKSIRREVKAWLVRDNPDFIECCERAMLDPDMVFKTFLTVKCILGRNATFKKFGPRQRSATTDTTTATPEPPV